MLHSNICSAINRGFSQFTRIRSVGYMKLLRINHKTFRPSYRDNFVALLFFFPHITILLKSLIYQCQSLSRTQGENKRPQLQGKIDNVASNQVHLQFREQILNRRSPEKSARSCSVSRKSPRSSINRIVPENTTMSSSIQL